MADGIRSKVSQPGDGEAYWQPVPANGYVEVQNSRHAPPTDTPFESGTQTVAPGCFVREHAHSAHEELILVFGGEGVAEVEGVEHPMQPGTSLYLAQGERHKFVSTSDEPLRFFWVLMPGGLGDFFKSIGRPKQAGEPAPEPFPRPEDVAQIEADTVFKKLTPE